MYSLPPPPPPLEVGLVGCSRLVGGTRQQASLEARWTRAPAGLQRGHFILSEQVSYHQQLTFRLSGHQQQQQKHRLELFFCHRVQSRYSSWIAFRTYATMLFQFVALKRPDLFEFSGQIASSDAREKKRKKKKKKKKKRHFFFSLGTRNGSAGLLQGLQLCLETFYFSKRLHVTPTAWRKSYTNLCGAIEILDKSNEKT